MNSYLNLVNTSLTLKVRKSDLKAYFVDLKEKLLGHTKILNLAIFRFFLLKCFALVLTLPTLLLPQILLIILILLVYIRSLIIKIGQLVFYLLAYSEKKDT